MSKGIAFLLSLQPVSVVAGAVLGYLFGGKVVSYAYAMVGTVVYDVKEYFSGLVKKL